MKFKLTLVASVDEGVAQITDAEVTIPASEGVQDLGSALAVILERIKEAGFGIS